MLEHNPLTGPGQPGPSDSHLDSLDASTSQATLIQRPRPAKGKGWVGRLDTIDKDEGVAPILPGDIAVTPPQSPRLPRSSSPLSSPSRQPDIAVHHSHTPPRSSAPIRRRRRRSSAAASDPGSSPRLTFSRTEIEGLVRHQAEELFAEWMLRHSRSAHVASTTQPARIPSPLPPQPIPVSQWASMGGDMERPGKRARYMSPDLTHAYDEVDPHAMPVPMEIVRVEAWPPQWLSNVLQAMRAKYPKDRFEITTKRPTSGNPEWRVKCLDCPGKLYTPGPGKTLSNYEVHLKNRQHRQRVSDRLDNS